MTRHRDIYYSVSGLADHLTVSRGPRDIHVTCGALVLILTSAEARSLASKLDTVADAHDLAARAASNGEVTS